MDFKLFIILTVIFIFINGQILYNIFTINKRFKIEDVDENINEFIKRHSKLRFGLIISCVYFIVVSISFIIIDLILYGILFLIGALTLLNGMFGVHKIIIIAGKNKYVN